MLQVYVALIEPPYPVPEKTRGFATCSLFARGMEFSSNRWKLWARAIAKDLQEKGVETIQLQHRAF